MPIMKDGGGHMPDKNQSIVKKSNMLARARWTARSVWEPRLVALLASKIQWNDSDFKLYHIHVSELFGVKYGGKEYRDLENAVDRAMSRVLTIRDEKGGWTKYNLFSKCKFIREKGLLELCFHPDLKPHYLELQQYVKYSLADFLQLPSIYSQRIFEILKSWSDKPEKVMDLIELHEILDTPQSMRKDFRQFRTRVLEKAQDDIEKCTDFKFAWEAIKKGRSVEAIRFIFSRKRVEEVKEEKRYKAKQRLQDRNNTLFRTYWICFSQRGDRCTGGYQKNDVCEVCLKFRDKERKKEIGQKVHETGI